jgi:hypothetical protein
MGAAALALKRPPVRAVVAGVAIMVLLAVAAITFALTRSTSGSRHQPGPAVVKTSLQPSGDGCRGHHVPHFC